jgi:hypothetical protein
MQSDFMQDMEMLLNCKKYIEKRIKMLEAFLERTPSVDRAESLKAEIKECKQVLGIAE